MQERPNKKLSLGAIAAMAIAALVVGTGSAWFAYRSITASQTPSTPTVSPSPATQVTKPIEKEIGAEVYWLSDRGGRLELVPAQVEVQKSASKQERLELAFEELLAGTKNASETTTIPEGTKLLSLSVKADGIHLNLSQDFTTGGGSASMTGRLAQVLYTATSIEPNSQVWIDVEGKPLELLGEGEGLMLEQPMTRKIFESDFEL
jgi:spore germination protein GerM